MTKNMQPTSNELNNYKTAHKPIFQCDFQAFNAFKTFQPQRFQSILKHPLYAGVVGKSGDFQALQRQQCQTICNKVGIQHCLCLIFPSLTGILKLILLNSPINMMVFELDFGWMSISSFIFFCFLIEFWLWGFWMWIHKNQSGSLQSPQSLPISLLLSTEWLLNCFDCQPQTRKIARTPKKMLAFD